VGSFTAPINPPTAVIADREQAMNVALQKAAVKDMILIAVRGMKIIKRLAISVFHLAIGR
jgi:UDP-N-acetylmuramyl tripeptide synthase